MTLVAIIVIIVVAVVAYIMVNRAANGGGGGGGGGGGDNNNNNNNNNNNDNTNNNNDNGNTETSDTTGSQKRSSFQRDLLADLQMNTGHAVKLSNDQPEARSPGADIVPLISVSRRRVSRIQGAAAKKRFVVDWDDGADPTGPSN